MLFEILIGKQTDNARFKNDRDQQTTNDTQNNKLEN